MPDRDCVEDGSRRDRRERDRPPNVCQDEDRTAPQPVDPDPSGQREQQERKKFQRGEQRDLERARVENEDRNEWQSELRHRRADLADALRRPKAQKIAAAPEITARAEALAQAPHPHATVPTPATAAVGWASVLAPASRLAGAS
jgi:hypothetical protein